MLRIELDQKGASLNVTSLKKLLKFCSEYLSSVTTIGLPKDSINVNQTNRGLSGVVVCTINREQRDQAHETILQNVGVESYIE